MFNKKEIQHLRAEVSLLKDGLNSVKNNVGYNLSLYSCMFGGTTPVHERLSRLELLAKHLGYCFDDSANYRWVKKKGK